MKHLKIGYGIVSALLIATTNVWAAGGVARQDNSGIFVWVFLGVCALIVAAQMVPALIMLVGATKGISEALRERQKVAAHSDSESH